MTKERFTIEDIDGHKWIKDNSFNNVEMGEGILFFGRLDECERLVALLNNLSNTNNELKQTSQDYEDNVYNWFFENWHILSDEQKQSAHLELGIDIDCDGDVDD